MRVIEAQGTVTADGELTVRVRVPETVAPGERRVVVMIDESSSGSEQQQELDLPLLPVHSWPENLSLRREDIYGDWGR